MADNIRKFLADKIIELRKINKISQAELSAKTGLSVARISEIERAIANPTIDTLDAIAKVFNTTPAKLIDYNYKTDNTEEIINEIKNNLIYLNKKGLQTILDLIQYINLHRN